MNYFSKMVIICLALGVLLYFFINSPGIISSVEPRIKCKFYKRDLNFSYSPKEDLYLEKEFMNYEEAFYGINFIKEYGKYNPDYIAITCEDKRK